MREKIKARVLTYLRGNLYPRTAERVAEDLNLNGEELKVYWSVIDELLDDNQVERYKNRLRSVDPDLLVEGILSVSAKGSGFVVPTGGGRNIFVHVSVLHRALDGDKVRVRLLPEEKGDRCPRGEIVKIIKHANSNIVGTYEKGDAFGIVIPDNPHIHGKVFVRLRNSRKAETGQKVEVQVTRWSETGKNMEGYVVGILGTQGEPGVDILTIMQKYGLSQDFPGKVRKSARKIPSTVPPEECSRREDRRYLPIVTIDGEDAKDLDDGVYAQKLSGGGYRLGVYIADVSWYVRENFPIDREARGRGTSVYLPDRVIPMLPPELSNGICSLNAGEDRLAMACEMEFTARGRLLGYRIFPTVIRVYRRLTYTLANKILVDKDAEAISSNQDILPHLETLAALRHILKGKHRRKGALDFNFPEVKVILDTDGNTVGIAKRSNGLAESIIEECMIAANEVVAQHLSSHKIPALYRIHEPPGNEKFTRLNNLLALFGMYVPVSKTGVKPKAIQQLLTKVAGHPAEVLISTMALRSMQQARYETKNLGHFGLAAKYYTHFTSPIRRYPDLMVHRLLRECDTPEKCEHYKNLLPDVALLSSKRERLAVEAEREALNLKEAEYMRQFIGEQFDGRVNSVTDFGMFVELENGVEGLVHLMNMNDDYYEYDAAHFAMIGRLSHHRYQIGDTVQIKVLAANLATHKIDFELVTAADAEVVKAIAADKAAKHEAHLAEKKAAKQERRRQKKLQAQELIAENIGEAQPPTQRKKKKKNKNKKKRDRRKSKKGSTGKWAKLAQELQELRQSAKIARQGMTTLSTKPTKPD